MESLWGHRLNPDGDPLRDGIALRMILSKGWEATVLIYQLPFIGQRSLLGINSASSPTSPKPRPSKLLLRMLASREMPKAIGIEGDHLQVVSGIG